MIILIISVGYFSMYVLKYSQSFPKTEGWKIIQTHAIFKVQDAIRNCVEERLYHNLLNYIFCLFKKLMQK